MGYERCSVAYSGGCPILQTESADLATRATEAKVHRVEDGKLRADVHPRHDDREWLLQLVGKAAGQPFLIHCIFHNEGLPLWNTQVV